MIATIGGARVLGREHEIGSLEPGKLADIAVWRVDGIEHAGILDPTPERLGDHLGHLGGRAARRVLLHPVVDLRDLDVVVVAEGLGHQREHAEGEVHPDAHVGREHDGHADRQTPDLVHLRGLESRRADDGTGAPGGGEPEVL